MVDDAAVRVSDAERERVAERLSQALGEGRLAPGEFDERVRAAYGAVVRGDLPPLTADLPAPGAADTAVSPGTGTGVVTGSARRGRRGRAVGMPRPLAAAVAVWAVVSALNFGIWAAVALAAPGPVHPWWIWVAGPWGAVLALHVLAARAGLPQGLPRGLPAVAVGLPCGGRRRR